MDTPLLIVSNLISDIYTYASFLLHNYVVCTHHLNQGRQEAKDKRPLKITCSCIAGNQNMEVRKENRLEVKE